MASLMPPRNQNEINDDLVARCIDLEARIDGLTALISCLLSDRRLNPVALERVKAALARNTFRPTSTAGEANMRKEREAKGAINKAFALLEQHQKS